MQQRLIGALISLGCAFLAAGTPTRAADPPAVTLGVGQGGYFSAWRVSGPFPATESPLFKETIEGAAFASEVRRLETAHPPEAVLGAAPEVSFETKRFRTALLSSRLIAPRARDVYLTVGSDGPVRVWLDGALVFSADATRRALPDTDLIRLSLTPGEHHLHIALENREKRRWRSYFRLLGPDFAPASDLQLVLPGSPGTSALSCLARLELTRRVDLEDALLEVTPTVLFPGAQPADLPGPCTVAFYEEEGVGVEFTADAIADLGTHRFDAEVIPETITVRCGEVGFTASIGVLSKHLRTLTEAAHLLRAAAGNEISTSTRESLLWRIAHLTELIESGDKDYLYLSRETHDTLRMARGLSRGEDPYHGRRHQLQRRGYRSRLDGKHHPYVLYVPPTWREEGDRRWGLVVMLHGLNAPPMKAIQSLFGRPLKESETGLARGRHPEPVDPAPFFVVAPNGFGPSGYRGFGEVDVLDVIDIVAARYRINPNRVYITGASMGGTGAAAIPLHYPDRFAAAAPLAGYHSMFALRSLRGRRFAPWERFLLEHRSNASWAANGRHLPLYLVHGAKDGPMHSRVLSSAFQRRNYDVQMKTPDLGHNVWDEAYRGGAIFNHFARYRRNPHPNRVTLRTARLRYRRAHWVTIDDVLDYSAWAAVNAEWRWDHRIRITTDNIAALSLVNDPVLRKRSVQTIEIDGSEILVASDAPGWSLLRTTSGWRLRGAPTPEPAPRRFQKRPGLAGPIDDVYYEPLLFVYGTGTRTEATLARRLAERMRKPAAGVTIDWPIKPDSAVTPEDIAERSLVIIGTPTGNALLERIAADLPIRVDGRGIVAGTHRYVGQAPAASFVYPNPLNPDRYVLVHTGVSEEALFYTDHLPQIVPDYLIYDGAAWRRKRERVLGDRPVLAAGFFDKFWQIITPDQKP